MRFGAFDGDPGIRPTYRQFVAYAAPGSRSPTTGSRATPSGTRSEDHRVSRYSEESTGRSRLPYRLEAIPIATKEEKIELEGEVVEALRNSMFRIALDNGHETLGYTAGKMRRYRIKIFPGDRVKIELSPYDLNRGRIVYRYK